MSELRVDRVSLPDRLPPAVVAAHLDKPAMGYRAFSATLEVAGYVIGREEAATMIEVVYRGRVLRSIPVNLDRPKLTAQHRERPGADRPGFAGLVSMLGLPTKFEIDVRVVLENSSRAVISGIEGTRTLLKSRFEPSYTPLVMTSLGRTGSTWLMNLLASHPQIVVRRRYPYECRAAKYWLQVLKLLSEPSVQPNGAGRLHTGAWWVGPNPYFEWDLVRGTSLSDNLFVARLAEVCQKNIDSWYRAIADEDEKQNACFFSEKFAPDMLPCLVREIYPRAKEVFLVRDFRDMVCSILAFDQKRGFSGFGRLRDEKVEPYIRRMGNSARSFSHEWESRKTSSHLIRYEDLLLEPVNSLRALLDFLELESSLSNIDAMLTQAQGESRSYRSHRTTASTHASIGRWKHELDPTIRDIANQTFGDTLEAFGYALGDSPVSA